MMSERVLGSEQKAIPAENKMQHHNINILDELVHKSLLLNDHMLTEQQEILLEDLKGVSLVEFQRWNFNDYSSCPC